MLFFVSATGKNQHFVNILFLEILVLHSRVFLLDSLKGSHITNVYFRGNIEMYHDYLITTRRVVFLKRKGRGIWHLYAVRILV